MCTRDTSGTGGSTRSDDTTAGIVAEDAFPFLSLLSFVLWPRPIKASENHLLAACPQVAVAATRALSLLRPKSGPLPSSSRELVAGGSNLRSSAFVFVSPSLEIQIERTRTPVSRFSKALGQMRLQLRRRPCKGTSEPPFLTPPPRSRTGHATHHFLVAECLLRNCSLF